MSGNHKSLLIKLLGLAITMAVMAAGPVTADDWPDIHKKLQAKYDKFDKAVEDLTIHQNITVKTQGREINTESVLFKKKNKFRMENSVDLPELPKEMGPLKTIVIHTGEATWMMSSMISTL